jgi:hypothetical protein
MRSLSAILRQERAPCPPPDTNRQPLDCASVAQKKRSALFMNQRRAKVKYPLFMREIPAP